MEMLFLSGGGSSEKYKSFDRWISSKLIGKNMLYIPFADKKKPLDDHRVWINKVFNKSGKVNIITVKDCNELRKVKLSEMSLIYIGGGNTFQLLKELKRYNEVKNLIDYYAQGGIIYGSSAGAAILGKSISTASLDDLNEIGLTKIRGYNLVADYSVYCHYKKVDNWKFNIFANKYKLKKIIAIPEGSIVLVNQDKIKAIRGDSYIVNRNKISKIAHLNIQKIRFP